ncbi:MAG: RDD family protein [Chloroflexi bacterium]|nr:RDD family protein [Chloroflexota bacterium]
MAEQPGKKSDKFDEYGQLAIGYDMAKARAWVLDHAQKNLPAKHDWLHGLTLAWEITSARFMEDQDAYEVIVSCYPEGAEVQAKGEWLYHVDVSGQLMPGTPVLRTALRHVYTRPYQGRSTPPPVAPSAPTATPTTWAPGGPATGTPEVQTGGAPLARETTPATTWPVATGPGRPWPTNVEAAAQPPVVQGAAFWTRFTAWLIDGIVAFLLLIPFLQAADPEIGDQNWSLLGGMIVAAWTLAFWVWRGQTPGKMLVGVRIVKADGSKLSAGRAVLRYIGYALSSFTLGIGFLMIAFDKQKRGLHDIIAGTRVIKVDRGKRIGGING